MSSATVTIDTWTPTDAQWDDYWERCPSATYFQGREWAEIWEAYSRGKYAPAPVGCTFPDGQRVIVPLSRERTALGLGRVHHLSPAGTFGAWLSPEPLSQQKREALSRFLLGRYPDLEWRLSPYEPAPAPPGAREDHTYRLDLTVGFEAIRRRWSVGHAHGARKARREGVRVEVAESAGDWADYVDVYLDTLARWGERAQVWYRRELFEVIAARRSPNVKLLLARHGSLTLAGTLCLWSPRIAVSWHSAARAAHLTLRPMDLLVHEAVRRAADEGLRWFDFNPSGWLEGVAAFKRGFGAEAVRADLYSARSARTRALATLSRAVKKVLRYDPAAPAGVAPRR